VGGVTNVVPATFDHAAQMAPRMRLSDRREIWASGMRTPLKVLMASLRAAPAWCGTADGVPVCMYGIVPAAAHVGVPWLLGTDDLPRYAVPFLRGSRLYIDRARREFQLLTNYIDARNETSIAWVRWLGFSVLPAVPFGPFGLPFHRFEMRRDHV